MHKLSLGRRSSPRYSRFLNEDEHNMRMNGSSIVFDSPFIEHFNREPWSNHSSILTPRSEYDSHRPRQMSPMDHIEESRRRFHENFHRQFIDGDFGFRRLNEDNSSARHRNQSDSRSRVIPIQVIREPEREYCGYQSQPAPRFIDVDYISDESDYDEPICIGVNHNNNGVRNLHSNIQPVVRRASPRRVLQSGNPTRVNSHSERQRHAVSDRLSTRNAVTERLAEPSVIEIDDSLTQCFQPSSSRTVHRQQPSNSTPSPNTSKPSVKKQLSVQHIESTPGYPVYAYLKSKLESDGRQVDYIQGDGNCFFRALSKEIYGQEEFHAEVRQAVMDVIEKYPKRFEQYLDDDASMKEHIKEMRLPSTWSTTMEIYGAATLLQRNIYVLSPNHTGETYSWLLFSPRFTYDGNMSYHPCYITLCHTNGNHYDRIAAKHHECNCKLNAPKLTGAECYVDLTNAELSVL